jgi:hypothetical protein
VFYVQKGTVKLTVVSNTGKEATIAMLGAGVQETFAAKVRLQARRSAWAQQPR